MFDSMNALLDRLVSALRGGRVAESIGLMQDWLKTARPGEAPRLVNDCPARVRPLLTTLMRDVLSGYPAVLLGCPLLIYAAPVIELDSPLSPCLWLPTLRSGSAQPCEGLQFEGWLPVGAEPPVNLLPQPFKPTVPVSWRTPTAAVALFRHDPETDVEDIDVPSPWWGDLFLSTPGQVRLSGKTLLPYPDALEAAARLQAAARGEPRESLSVFLSEDEWAFEAGAAFAADCTRDLI